MGVPASAYYVGVMHIRGKNHGWCEKYNLGALSGYPGAIIDFNFLVQARRMILANTFEICWARVSHLDTARERKAVVTSPTLPLNLDTEAGPPIAIGECNDVKSCIHLALETDTGKWANRFLRGVRDEWVLGNLCTVTPSVPGAVVIGDLVAGKTAAVALGSFIRCVLGYDRYRFKDGSNPTTYDSLTWTSWAIRGITARDTGRPFGCGRGRAPKETPV